MTGTPISKPSNTPEGLHGSDTPPTLYDVIGLPIGAAPDVEHWTRGIANNGRSQTNKKALQYLEVSHVTLNVLALRLLKV